MDLKLGQIVLTILVSLSACHALLEGLYCGKTNCYDVLEVTRESTKVEIQKAYRKLAKIHHPDMHRSAEAKEEAQQKFQLIAQSYEILKDEDSRNDYNYMLDHPEEMYRNYYNYYRNRMTPKVDVRLVVAITLALITAIQYWSSWQNYNSAIDYALTVPRYRFKAMHIAQQSGYLEKLDKKNLRKSTKEEVREMEEKALRRVLEENMDIRGGYAKPVIWDLFIFRLVVFPYSLYKYVTWLARWVWKFNIRKEEYGKEEKLYLLAKNMGVALTEVKALEEHVQSDYLKKELWIKNNFDEWVRESMANNNKAKRSRRLMKQHGQSQISFLDEM